MTDLSPAFENAVETGGGVVLSVKCAWVYVMIASAAGPHAAKWYWGSRFWALVFIAIWTVGSMVLIQSWFSWVSSRAASEADLQWIRDHDGGLLIPLFLCAVAGVFCMLVHILSWVIQLLWKRGPCWRRP